VDTADALKAPLASPALTGSPTAPTQSAGDNSTKIATTAYADTGLALKANLASPTFTGTPAAPTATQGNNSTQLATTAYVDTGLATKEGAWTYERLTVDFTRTANTLADVFTGFAPSANKSYEFEVFGAIISDAATTGFQSDFNGPTGENWVAYKINSGASATTDLLTHGTSWATLNTATNGLAGTNVFIARGMTSYGASPGAGNIRLRARCEAGGGAMSVTMKAGSYMRWRQLP
jgi:hypothetical protein